MNVKFDTLTHASGSIRIANSAYQKWPTKRFPFCLPMLVLWEKITTQRSISCPLKVWEYVQGKKEPQNV